MYPQVINTFSRNNLVQISESILEFIEYLEQYRHGLMGILANNPVAKYFYPPAAGWPMTLVHCKEMQQIDAIKLLLQQFITEGDQRLSIIEFILNLDKCLDKIPKNSVFFKASGMRELLSMIKTITGTGLEVLKSTVDSDASIKNFKGQHLFVLQKIEHYHRVLNKNNLDINHKNSVVITLDSFMKHLTKIEYHICNTYLFEDLASNMPLSRDNLAEIRAFLENGHSGAVGVRLQYLRLHLKDVVVSSDTINKAECTISKFKHLTPIQREDLDSVINMGWLVDKYAASDNISNSVELKSNVLDAKDDDEKANLSGTEPKL
ncbi:MAG: hypothetical protein KC414_12240 [Romboutsia sp.]|nr:hypothetical protein [Romboutsia sp.]